MPEEYSMQNKHKQEKVLHHRPHSNTQIPSTDMQIKTRSTRTWPINTGNNLASNTSAKLAIILHQKPFRQSNTVIPGQASIFHMLIIWRYNHSSVNHTPPCIRQIKNTSFNCHTKRRSRYLSACIGIPSMARLTAFLQR